MNYVLQNNGRLSMHKKQERDVHEGSVLSGPVEILDLNIHGVEIVHY